MNRGGIQIDREVTLLELPRGRDEKEKLRVSHVYATTDHGGTDWISLRVWFTGDDGQMHPGKAGITIRSKEIERVLRVLVDDWRASKSAKPAPTETRTRHTAPARVPGSALPTPQTTPQTTPPEDDGYTPADDEGVF